MNHADENPAIEAIVAGELELPSGQIYEIGVGKLVNKDDEVTNRLLPEGPWRLIHFRMKGREVWLRGYSSAFLFRVGASTRPEAGMALFPSMTSEHARKVLEMAGIPNGTASR